MSSTLRFPLLRIMASNAFLLSAMYLILGVLLEAGRRFLPANLLGRIAMRLSLALDALPARVLDAVGLLDPIRVAYLEGGLPSFVIRIAFGLTTILLISLLAFATGTTLVLLRKLMERRER